MCVKCENSYSHALEFVPDCYKLQKRCNKAIDNSHSAVRFKNKIVYICPSLLRINIRVKKMKLFLKIFLC